MFWSRCDFFKQSELLLRVYRVDLIIFLGMKGYKKIEIKDYLEAYDYFVINPSKFDGATIVKDLHDLYKLDLDAMLHDYNYIVKKSGHNFKTKWEVDWLYAKGMERKGKGQYSAFSRFAGLTITGIIWVPYTNLKTLLTP